MTLSFPYDFSLSFSTAIDKQTMKIKIFEGDQERREFDHLLGEFRVVGILPGVTQVEVTFELDANSILTIRALENGT